MEIYAWNLFHTCSVVGTTSIEKMEVECYLFMHHPINFPSFKHENEPNVTFDPYQAAVSLILTSKCFEHFSD